MSQHQLGKTSAECEKCQLPNPDIVPFGALNEDEHLQAQQALAFGAMQDAFGDNPFPVMLDPETLDVEERLIEAIRSRMEKQDA